MDLAVVDMADAREANRAAATVPSGHFLTTSPPNCSSMPRDCRH